MARVDGERAKESLWQLECDGEEKLTGGQDSSYGKKRKARALSESATRLLSCRFWAELVAPRL
jgi:hypothetical protein